MRVECTLILSVILLVAGCAERGPRVSPIVSEGQTEIHDHEGSAGVNRDDLGDWWGLRVNVPFGG